MAPIVIDRDSITYIPFRSRYSCQRAIACSPDGDLAVLAEKYICVLKLECQPTRSDSRYVWTKDLIRLPAHPMAYPVRVEDFALTKRHKTFDLSNPHLKSHCDRPLLFENKTHACLASRSGWIKAEWSSQGLDENFKSVMLALTIDHRLLCYFKPDRIASWSAACDISRLFQRYYLDNGRVPNCYDINTDSMASGNDLTDYHDFNDQSCLNCESMTEYFDSVSDMMIIDLSWSELYRQSSSSLEDVRASFVTLHKSGAVGIWSVRMPVKGSDNFSLSGIDYKHCVEITELDHLPIMVKVCDFSSKLMFIVLARTDGLVLGQLFIRDCDILDKWRRAESLITIWDRPDDQPVTSLNWSRMESMLYVGKGPLIWIFALKLESNEENGADPCIIVSDKCQMTGENDLVVTGMAHLGRTLYVCSADGRLQEVVIDAESSSITTERINVTLPVPRPPHQCHNPCQTPSEASPQRKRERYQSNWEYNGVFASRNGAVLGLLASPVGYFDNVETVAHAKRNPSLALFSVWNEDKLLAFLINETIAFRFKRDVVEELRRLFVVSRESLLPGLMRLLDSESNWPSFSWHNLQLMHLLACFMTHEKPEHQQEHQLQQILNIQQQKMQHQLEERQRSLGVNTSHSTNGESNDSSGNSTPGPTQTEPNEEDQRLRADNERKLTYVRQLLLGKHLLRCINIYLQTERTLLTPEDTVLLAQMIVIARRSKLIETCSISEDENSLKFVVEKAEKHDEMKKILPFVSSTEQCPVCHEEYEANYDTLDVFRAVCSSQHTFARCCQTFRPCSETRWRECSGCGALANKLDEFPSSWRREILSPFCPFCDGDLF